MFNNWACCQLGFRWVGDPEKSSRFGQQGIVFKLMKSLYLAPFFETVVISHVDGEPGLTRRLREMGFHKGCEVRILGQAPFNGPLVVQLHDSVLALRQVEAECLRIR
jgi:ferrous iron transport protein A